MSTRAFFPPVSLSSSIVPLAASSSETPPLRTATKSCVDGREAVKVKGRISKRRGTGGIKNKENLITDFKEMK